MLGISEVPFYQAYGLNAGLNASSPPPLQLVKTLLFAPERNNGPPGHNYLFEVAQHRTYCAGAGLQCL
jgi:hypothetical protein